MMNYFSYIYFYEKNKQQPRIFVKRVILLQKKYFFRDETNNNIQNTSSFFGFLLFIYRFLSFSVSFSLFYFIIIIMSFYEQYTLHDKYLTMT